MVPAHIYVKDYADSKFGYVPVAFYFLCHYRPRELPGRKKQGAMDTKRVAWKGFCPPYSSISYLQNLTYIVPNHWMASFGLRNRDT